MAVTLTSSNVFSNSTLVQILDDLCVRFIINLPTEEMHSVERVCFQIEEAQWYYEDFVRGHNPNLPTLSLRNFASKIFQHCPSLHEWKDSHEQAMNQFIEYKSRVPVRGAILLNPDLDHCVLVRGMKASASWSFPRGKINQDEEDDVCAVREVLEETGFDASKLINPDWYIEQSIRNQNIRLYVIPGVPFDTHFAPRTRNEIGSISWHHLSDLPTFSKRKANGEGPKMGKYYMVAPFLPHLRKWIQTDGAQWKVSHGASDDVDIPAPTDDEQNEQNGVNLEDTYTTTEPAVYEDSSATLRSLLGIHAESLPDPVANQVDAAAKLKSLLSIGESSEPSPPSSISANGQILLSLLQSGPTPKKIEPQPRGIPPTTQPPVTPTRAPAAPATASVMASPHPTVLHQGGVPRKPLTPLYDAPLAQPPTTFASPSYKPNKPSQVASNSRATGPYSQAPPPGNALLVGLQSQAKPVAMTEQASALLKTLTSTNSPPRQAPTQKAPVPSPLDIFFAADTQKAPDTQQKMSLLSILKGESQPAPTKTPVQKTQPVPITPVSPATHAQAQHHPQPLNPRPQTPISAIAKAAARSPAARSPAARSPAARSPAARSPAAKRDNQHFRAPTSPRGPRVQRTARNGDYPKPTPATQPSVAPSSQAPPALQVQTKRITPPLEPYLNSPANRTAGVSLNASPVLARATTDAMFDRRETANQEQQKTLLALFKKPSVSTLKQELKESPVPVPAASASPVTESSMSPTARLKAAVKKVQGQQVPAMKTGGGVSLGQARGDAAAASPRSPLTPGGGVAFAKDAFLWSYLEGVAKGAGK